MSLDIWLSAQTLGIRADRRTNLGYLVTHPHAERPAPYKFVTEDASMLDIAVNIVALSQYVGRETD